MTKKEIEDLIFSTCPEGADVSTGWESGYGWDQTIKLMTAAYNLALEHAAEKAKKDQMGQINEVEILNFKITE